MTTGLSSGVMNPSETLVCIAVAPKRTSSGEIDVGELEGYLNRVFGRSEWLLLSHWFSKPVPSANSLPVLCPERVARHSRAETRCALSHSPDEAELMAWRLVAARVYPWAHPVGSLPWEIANSLAS
jgi:hypothetical protein